MTLPAALLAMSMLSGLAAGGPIARIPFEFSGHHTFIDVGLNGRTLSFVFDTGAGGVAISEAVGRRLELEPTGRAPATGAAGTVQVPLVGELTLEIGDLKIGGITAGLVDLDHLQARLGRTLDGIIGQDVLRGRVVLLDHDEQVLEVYEKGTFPFDGWGEACVLKGAGPLSVQGSIRLSGGEQIRGDLFVDTGAGVFVSLNAPFARRHGLSDRLGGTYSRKGGGLTGVTVHDRIGRIAAVGFCREEFPAERERTPGTVPAVLSGATAGVQARRGPAGLLGNAVLRRYNLVFDLDRRRMYVKPNTHRDDPILTDASGLALIRRPDGAVVIDDVVARSPAADLELIRGDELRSIDGTDIRTMTLDAVRDRLKRPDRKLGLVTVRNGDAREIVLETRTLWSEAPARGAP